MNINFFNYYNIYILLNKYLKDIFIKIDSVKYKALKNILYSKKIITLYLFLFYIIVNTYKNIKIKSLSHVCGMRNKNEYKITTQIIYLSNNFLNFLNFLLY